MKIPTFLVCLFSSFGFYADETLCWKASKNLASENVNPSICEPASSTETTHSEQRPFMEAKAGYFFFLGSMDKVYNHGGLDVQLSGSYPVYKALHIYASLEWLEKSGYSLNAHQKTSLWALPVSLGIRPVIPIGNYVSYYASAGPRYLYIHTHNRSIYVPSHLHANGIGFFLNTGFLFHCWHGFTIDLFGEYSYARAHFHSFKEGTESRTVTFSGLTFSGGCGYSF